MPFLYTIDKPTEIDLKKFSTDKVDDISKSDAAERVLKLSRELDDLQEKLYASGTHSVLIVLQAMDTAGKDGTISHVFESVNPQGCSVVAFKQPTPLESSHDFLWRAHAGVPAKGMVTIFNRSHYEDVLVVRVHDLVPKSVWSKRYDEIENFESLLVKNNTIVLKFFLHITKEEQRLRLLEREDDLSKAWKLSAADWHERDYWDSYTKAYEDAIGKTSVKDAPWFIVPADHKWYRNHAIATTLVEVLSRYKPLWESQLKTIGEQKLAELKQMREKDGTGGPDASVKKQKKH